MILTKIILVVLLIIAVVLLFGVIGEKNPMTHKNVTYAFCATVIAIAIIVHTFL